MVFPCKLTDRSASIWQRLNDKPDIDMNIHFCTNTHGWFCRHLIWQHVNIPDLLFVSHKRQRQKCAYTCLDIYLDINTYICGILKPRPCSFISAHI